METTSLNASSAMEQVSLSKLMARLGYKPTRSNGDEDLYLNVLRTGKIKPTFLVNTKLDVWYDRSNKKSGNLIDFGLAYWPGLNSEQVSQKIDQLFAANQPSTATSITSTNSRKRKAIKIPFYHIQEVKPVGCNPEITTFLQSKNIWEIAIGHLKEVYYYVVDEKRRRKDFFAAGWQNENGGWEVISKNFSGCLGRKGMTFIQGSKDSLVIFIDYISYLGWKYANKVPGPSILILNSQEYLTAAKKRAAKFQDVAVFFDKQYLDAELLSAIEGLNPQKIVVSP